MKREKKLVPKVIFYKHYDNEYIGFKYSDLPADLEPEDTVKWETWPETYHSDGGDSAGSKLYVERMVLETDEEMEERVSWWEKRFARSKEERRQQFLKLKKEFEPDEK